MGNKVIVIDNDSQVRGVICAALEADGFVTVGVGTYPDALERLSGSSADLAISDGFTSDGISGVSLLHRLFPALRLLILSGGVDHELTVPFSTQCLSILPKPCSIQTLRRAVRQILRVEDIDPLQNILEQGRLGFLMVVLRSSPCEL